MKETYRSENDFLLSAVRHGDQKAFDTLFRKYYPMLCAYGHRFVDLEDAEVLRRELADAVAVFARLNRADLFTKAKSLDLAFGTIGFRASTRIVQMRGITSGMTLEKLHQYNFTDGIRIKEEVDKERAADWPDERLELVGLKRQTSDTFFIEIRRDAVPEQIGQGETHGAARIQEIAD